MKLSEKYSIAASAPGSRRTRSPQGSASPANQSASGRPASRSRRRQSSQRSLRRWESAWTGCSRRTDRRRPARLRTGSPVLCEARPGDGAGSPGRISLWQGCLWAEWAYSCTVQHSAAANGCAPRSRTAGSAGSLTSPEAYIMISPTIKVMSLVWPSSSSAVRCSSEALFWPLCSGAGPAGDGALF